MKVGYGLNVRDFVLLGLELDIRRLQDLSAGQVLDRR